MESGEVGEHLVLVLQLVVEAFRHDTGMAINLHPLMGVKHALVRAEISEAVIHTIVQV